ncbi:hypothetical protein GALMADRAFT_1359045 [Galerina marginata CBS 339.88]|uniref:G domain-containing protein n=1 Tax=Galerina marginata (strain CBS 339.88) TaxID=685588 RepID=A0A067SAC8_GALM3|nr:hypothetical protein GALMADRAFT_1359045 [Galerina marginata CBS 339.88]
MGPTGSGKSHIIDTLTGEVGKRAGYTSKSFTTEVSGVRIKNSDIHRDCIVLLDTPALYNTPESDLEVLQFIRKWRKKRPAYLAGILYLHRITDNRMPGTSSDILRGFQHHFFKFREQPADRVVLVTTMWDRVQSKEVGESREEDLKRNFWRPVIESDATVARFENTKGSAWKIINDAIAVTEPNASDLEAESLVLQEQIDAILARLRPPFFQRLFQLGAKLSSG